MNKIINTCKRTALFFFFHPFEISIALKSEEDELKITCHCSTNPFASLLEELASSLDFPSSGSVAKLAVVRHEVSRGPQFDAVCLCRTSSDSLHIVQCVRLDVEPWESFPPKYAFWSAAMDSAALVR